MNKFIIFLLIGIYLIPNNIRAQDNEAIAGAALGSIIGAAVAIHQLKELAELKATQYLIKNNPELNQFELKTLDFDGKKMRDMSSTSVITYRVREFDIIDEKPVLGARMVLFAFTSYGWVNNQGINFAKIKWHLVDEEEWLNMMVAYTKLASGKQNESELREALRNGKVWSTKIRTKGKDVKFYKIKGDMYLVEDYSPLFKFVYNESSFGIYLKETMDLVQIGRMDLIKIHKFIMEE